MVWLKSGIRQLGCSMLVQCKEALLCNNSHTQLGRVGCEAPLQARAQRLLGSSDHPHLCMLQLASS